MKTLKIFYCATAATVALLSVSCGPRLEHSQVPMSTGGAPRSDGTLSGRIHSEVNAHRGAIGKSMLPRHAGLDRLAQQHSEYMAGNRNGFKGGLTHNGFEERTMTAQRLMNMGGVAENIATCSGGFTSPSTTMVEAWKNSSGHAANMKNEWDVTGVGVAVAPDGTVFATQLFASVSNSHMAVADRMRKY